MSLSTDLETAKNELRALDLLKVGQDLVVLSERDIVLLSLLRLILSQLGSSVGGGGGGVGIDYDALATAIAGKTLTVTGDSVNESGLASAIAAALNLPSTYSATLTTANVGAIADAIATKTLTTSGTVSVGNFPATQPVSLSALPPLPTGANAIGSVSISNFPVTQPVSLATLPALATGSNAIGSITNTSFASTQSGTWSVRNQDGTGNSLTSQASGSQRALDVGVNVGGSQIDPRSIRALTSSDIVSVANFPATQAISGTVALSNGSFAIADATTPANKLGINSSGQIGVSNFPATQTISGSVSVSNFPATQAVSLAALPTLPTGSNTIGSVNQAGSWTVSLSAGANSIGSIANTTFASTQSGTWSVRNQDGTGNSLTSQANGLQRALDVGIAVSGVQVDPRSIRALTSVDVVSSVQSGTWTVGLATGSNAIGSITNTAFASTQSGTWSTRTQDGAGNLLTSQVSGSQRALDVGVVVAGTQVDPRSIRALTSSDVVSAAQSGTWAINVNNFPATQAVSLSSLPALAAGSNAIGSITNTSFASTQSGTWSTRTQDGSGNSLTSQSSGSQRALDVGIAVAGTQVDPRSIRALTSSDVISSVQSGTWTVGLSSGGAGSTVTFSGSTTSATFTISDKFVMAQIPNITGAPTITLQTSLDGTNWANTSVAVNSSASASTVIESDAFARVIAGIGLSGAFRFLSSASIAATINIRQSHA